jgi:hypothetical protein
VRSRACAPCLTFDPGLGSPLATSAPGLAHPQLGLADHASSAPGLGPPPTYPHRDGARPCRFRTGTGFTPCRIRTGTGRTMPAHSSGRRRTAGPLKSCCVACSFRRKCTGTRRCSRGSASDAPSVDEHALRSYEISPDHAGHCSRSGQRRYSRSWALPLQVGPALRAASRRMRLRCNTVPRQLSGAPHVPLAWPPAGHFTAAAAGCALQF